MRRLHSKRILFQPIVISLLPVLLFFCAISGYSLSLASLSTLFLFIITSLSPFVILSLGGQYQVNYQLFCASFHKVARANISHKSKPILVFLILTFFFELAVAGNLPLFYYLGVFSSSIDYASFGVKSVHGVFNAVCFLYFIIHLNTNQRSRFIQLYLPLCFFVLTYSRGWLFVCLGYFFIHKLILAKSLSIMRSKIVGYIFVLFAILISSFIFGIIGQLRVFLAINEPFWSTQIPLPFTQSLLEWPYIYLVGSTANSLNIIEHVIPTPELFPEWLLSKFLPSASSIFFGDLNAPDVYNFESLRIHELVTTSSLHADIYIISGFIGCLLFFSLFWLLLSLFIKKSCSDPRFFILLPYLIFQAYLFPFSNIVLELPFMLPYLAMFTLFKKSDFSTSSFSE